MNLQDFHSSLQACRDLETVLLTSVNNLPDLQRINVGPDIRTATIAGGVLLGVARFEEYIKSVADHYLTSFGRANPPIMRSALSKRLQSQILIKNLVAATRTRNHGIARSDDEIVQDLHTLAGMIAADTIWGDHAIETKSNPGPETVKEILALLGVQNPWALIDVEFGSLWTVKKNADQNLDNIVHPKEFLETVLLWRNQCAHTGQIPPIGPAEIKNMIAFLECLSSSIDNTLSKHHSDYVHDLGSIPAPW